MKELDGAVLSFIGHDAGEGDAGSIVDCDMDVFPSRAPDFIAAIARDAEAGPLDAGELFDIEVNEFTGVRSLVATRGRRRIQQRKAVETVVTQDPRDGRLGEAALRCDLEAWEAQPTKREGTTATCAGGVYCGLLRGREERS